MTDRLWYSRKSTGLGVVKSEFKPWLYLHVCDLNISKA